MVHLKCQSLDPRDLPDLPSLVQPEPSIVFLLIIFLLLNLLSCAAFGAHDPSSLQICSSHLLVEQEP